MLQELHFVLSEVGCQADTTAIGEFSGAGNLCPDGPGVPIGFGVWVLFARIVVLVGLEALNIARGFLVEIAAINDPGHGPVANVSITANR